MAVPFLDLTRQYQRIKTEIDQAILRVVESQHFILGKEVEAFEKELAQYLGVKYAVGVASGTDALILSLKALGIGEGDEVITSVYGFFASAGAISWVGAVPVFVDIEPEGFNLDPEQIPSKITSRTRAILPVHLFGEPARMKEIMEIARKYHLYVIEDACQSLGAELNGGKIGTIGDIGCFSFYPTKVLGGYGDGGLVATNSREIYERILELRVHGARGEKDRKVVGTNSRLDEIQASVLRVKLKYLEPWIKERREKAKFYHQELSSLPVKLPRERAGIRHTYNSYVIRTGKREEIIKIFQERKIGYAIYYQRPFHKYSCFLARISQDEKFPNAEKRVKESLALPIFPELTKDEQEEMIEILRDIYAKF